MNTVQVMGNLTKDVQIRRTQTGRSVANFTVAVNREFIGQNGEKKQMTDYIPVVAWGAQADAAAQELYKGSRVFVEGRYTSRSYETQTGEKKYVTEVMANFIAVPLKTGSGAQGASGGYNVPSQGANGQMSSNFSQFGAPSYEQEDIPF